MPYQSTDSFSNGSTLGADNMRKLNNNLNYLKGRTPGDATIELEKPLELLRYATSATLPTLSSTQRALVIQGSELKFWDGTAWQTVSVS